MDWPRFVGSIGEPLQLAEGATAGREIAKLEFSDGYAHQAQRRITHGRRHAPDLAVLAFDQPDFELSRHDASGNQSTTRDADDRLEMAG